MKKHTSTLIFFLLVLALLGSAVWVFIRCTPYGVGLVSDSVNYINGARSIAQGNGYFRESGGGTLKPITNFTPLYSILLSLPIRAGLDGIQAAWWVSLIFFVLNFLLLIVLVWKGSGCRWAGLAAGLLFLASRPFLYFQFFAMSEPVFFFFTLLAFILLIDAFQSQKPLLWFGCGLACGCAFLSRYIGAVSVCAVFAVILIFVNQRKGRSLFSFLAGSLPLIAAWLVRNALVSGSASNRQILTHWVSLAELKTGVLIFWRWIFPSRYGKLEAPTAWMCGALGLLIVIFLLFVLVVLIRHLRKKTEITAVRMITWSYCLYFVGYLAFVVLTISLFDASVNIEERILFPAFMILLLLFLTLTGWVWHSRRRIPAVLLTLCLAFGLAAFAGDTIDKLPEMSETGYGWAWEGWKTSPAMLLVQKLPMETEIYSNQQEAISLWAGRGAYALLDPVDPSSNQMREGYDETMRVIRQQVLDGDAVLVFFGIESWLGDNGKNWVSQLCDGLPFLYQDTSEWVVGKKELIQ